jgi:raffinose/stachyose/melibiose transport system substrate-binding protein
MKKNRLQLISLLVLSSIILSACGTATPTAAPVIPTEKSAAVPTVKPTEPPPPAAEPTEVPAATLPSCGTDPVVMKVVFETGWDMPTQLTEEFTRQFPNVTWDISMEQFANLITTTPMLLASDNPPDLIRLPTMVTFAQDGLLKNLDDYATAFGWNDWPVPQINQNRLDENWIRGSGTLYAMGLNYSMTGVFYNKELAAQIGMTEPPKTVAEFEALLAAAKAAGLQPIMEWGSAKSGMGLAFPLQNLMAAYGPVGPINDWIFQKPGATIDTPTNLIAAQHLQDWIEKGYFPFPPAEAGGGYAAMSAPLTYGIAANAKHADCAAFFFTWAATNETARQINVDGMGSNPGGPADASVPTVAAGSVTIDTLAAGPMLSGAMDFIANATSSIFAQGWTPELQKMVAGEQDAAGLLKAVQAEYEREISQ